MKFNGEIILIIVADKMILYLNKTTPLLYQIKNYSDFILLFIIINDR